MTAERLELIQALKYTQAVRRENEIILGSIRAIAERNGRTARQMRRDVYDLVERARNASLPQGVEEVIAKRITELESK